jgi:hypothetical protein
VPPGFARHDALVAAFAERLGRDWIPAAGLLALVGKLAVAGEAERLRAAVGRACAESGPWPGHVCAAIDAVLRFAVEDPAAARLLLVDVWGHGEDASPDTPPLPQS